ncbi:calcium-binding protein [Nocardioides terrigena]|uniref:calcium-binding protein n=1 Tax=Nocardioides terrigena TaxID=424797 RepID=UPI000D30F3B2|nr:calcium-binding protein [Nocardioides terrigena]
MRRTTAVTALLLGTTLLAPTGFATAAGETCRGEAATIVGTEYNLQGTEGRDVIVTGASGNVLAGGGDDVICATGAGSSGNTLTIDAGAGNDLVDSTALENGYYLHAILGDGADTFVGGSEDDRVTAGAAAPRPADLEPSEVDRDQIDTGEGADSVTSGGPGLPNDDVVRTGAGHDYVRWSGTMGAAGVLDGGEGEDRLNLRVSGQTVSIDLAAQTLTRDGVRAASFSSFEALLRVSPEPGLGAVAVLGTDDDDVVEIDRPAVVRADLGRGNDALGLVGTASGSHFDLGAGTDRVDVRSGISALDILSSDGSVDLDLAQGQLVVNGSHTASFADVEDAAVLAYESTVIGNDKANRFFAAGCFATINGRGGKDFITHSTFDPMTEIGYSCERGGATLRGGSGNDNLSGKKLPDRIYGGSGNDDIRTSTAIGGVNKAWGGPGNDKLTGGGDKDVLAGGAGDDRLEGSKQADVLRGGAGKDRGLGGPGRDRCKTEVERSCER